MTPDAAATLFNTGWSLTMIAEFLGCSKEDVVAAIRQHVREEREELKKLESAELMITP